MKKLFLLTLLLAAAYGLKAQQLFNVKPADSLSQRLLGQYFKLQPGNSFKPVRPLLNPNPMLAVVEPQKNAFANQDNMPIAVLKENSKMPVAKLGGYYTMLVKHIGIRDTTINKAVAPGVLHPGK